jgi:hypothetical protein
MSSIDASVFDKDEFVIFSFNADGTKKWFSSEASGLPTSLLPGTGYYVYARTGNVNVPLKELSGATTGVQVHLGWNLLSNSADADTKLSDLKFNVAKTSDCTTVSCTESKTLRELYAAGRAYSKIYVVTDDKTTDASKAFQVLTVDSSNVDTLTISSQKIFWFYLK